VIKGGQDMITLTSSFQLAATVTSSALGSNYGCRLYLKYSGNTVYYEVRYYGYQRMAYNGLSSYIKYSNGAIKKDLSGSCYGGSTATNAEWTWRTGSWEVSNTGTAYTESLYLEAYGCPSKDSGRGTASFDYSVPAQWVANSGTITITVPSLQDVATATSLNCSWTEPTIGAGNGIDNYYIYARGKDTSDWKYIGATTDRSYTISEATLKAQCGVYDQYELKIEADSTYGDSILNTTTFSWNWAPYNPSITVGVWDLNNSTVSVVVEAEDDNRIHQFQQLRQAVRLSRSAITDISILVKDKTQFELTDLPYVSNSMDDIYAYGTVFDGDTEAATYYKNAGIVSAKISFAGDYAFSEEPHISGLTLHVPATKRGNVLLHGTIETIALTMSKTKNSHFTITRSSGTSSTINLREAFNMSITEDATYEFVVQCTEGGSAIESEVLTLNYSAPKCSYSLKGCYEDSPAETPRYLYAQDNPYTQGKVFIEYSIYGCSADFSSTVTINAIGSQDGSSNSIEQWTSSAKTANFSWNLGNRLFYNFNFSATVTIEGATATLVSNAPILWGRHSQINKYMPSAVTCDLDNNKLDNIFFDDESIELRWVDRINIPPTKSFKITNVQLLGTVTGNSWERDIVIVNKDDGTEFLFTSNLKFKPIDSNEQYLSESSTVFNIESTNPGLTLSPNRSYSSYYQLTYGELYYDKPRENQTEASGIIEVKTVDTKTIEYSIYALPMVSDTVPILTRGEE
jgi:hypothetical protein